MIKCTKQWTLMERNILERASLLLSEDDEYLCNNVQWATRDTHGAYDHQDCKPILAYIKSLLGTQHTLTSWLEDHATDLPVDRFDLYENSSAPVRIEIRREWVRWMLGEVEADGSKFPIYVKGEVEADGSKFPVTEEL